MQRYATLVRFAILIALCVIVLGAYTRLSDAGLGCPDWPGCYGQLLVPDSEHEVEHKPYLEQRPLEPHKGWAEMVHRYFAGTLGLLILALAVWAWRRRHDPRQPVWLPGLLLGVVVMQALLGMWTVTLLLKPVVVMAHLLGGFATLALLWLLLLRVDAGGGAAVDAHNDLRSWALAGLAVLVLQIALGGWTSTNYAAMSCPDFPTCQGSWWPQSDFGEAFVMWRGLGINYEFGVLEHPARTAIHLTHRIGALATLLVLGGLALALLRRGGGLRLPAAAVAALLLTQVGLGIGNILLHLPLPLAVAHNAVAALLLLSMVYVNYLLWQRQY